MSTTTAQPQPAPPAVTDIPRFLAGLIGFLAVGAALGVGHLVAGFVSPVSSPFLSVGDTVIRFSPQVLTEFAKTTFGVNDKPVLLAGMAVVILLIVAPLAGIASRRHPRPGVIVISVLGLLGLAAVVFAPVFRPFDVVAPLVALVVGVAAFLWLHRLARPVTGPAAASGISRRRVLVGSSVAMGVGALAAAGVGQYQVGAAIARSRAAVTARLAGIRLAETALPIPAGAAFPEVGTPTFLTSNAEFYRVDTALQIATQPAEAWTLRIHGMVDREITLTFDDLLARPLVERTITMTCVSNEVGGPFISTANFIGVDLREILLEAGIRPGAEQALSTSFDQWTAGTPLPELMEPDRGALLAIAMNGEALPLEHGFPVRMVVPGMYGFLSATKWLSNIELTTFAAEQGYWLQRDWGQEAPIKTQSRIDVPGPFQRVPAGPFTVAGIAWSQPAGISRVEVRVDGGPWQEAELSAAVNPVTWRMWRTEFDLPAGLHNVQSRATDGNGVTQPEEMVPPIPDGATGWPRKVFTSV